MKLKIIVVLVVVIAVVVAIFAYVSHKRTQQRMQAIQAVESKLPSYFLPSNTESNANNIQASQVSNAGSLILDKQQQVSQQISYTVNKPQKQAVTDFFETYKKNGWMAIEGSGQTLNQTTFKVRNDKQFLFAVFDDLGNNKTKITLIPVEGK